jgi:hypothetical protein
MAVFLSSASVVDMISFKQPRAKSKPSNPSPLPREAEGLLRGLPRRLAASFQFEVRCGFQKPSRVFRDSTLNVEC